jgi:hypothetical protein
MGSFLDKPKTTHEVEEKEGNGLKAGLAAMQGWRIDMEVSSQKKSRLLISHTLTFPLFPLNYTSNRTTTL